jgi:hypothetical protein
LRRLLWLATLLPATAFAQLAPISPIVPSRIYLLPSVGPFVPFNELLRNTAIYSTPRPSDPTNPVVTDISIDPGLFTGVRVGYGLTRRLSVETEGNFAISVCAIRQLEIRDDSNGTPQYETTTFDAHIYQYSLNLVYYGGPWSKVQLMGTTGVGEHILDLRRKGAVDPSPVRDRMIMGGMGLAIQATDRLSIRGEVRDFMYNFRFDNEFVDPALSQEILFRRSEFINTTSIAGDKFQNDVAFTLTFMVRTF